MLSTRCPIFEGLLPEQLELIMDRCTTRYYNLGDLVFSIGEHAPTIFLVVNGTVRLEFMDERGKAGVLREVRQGEIFGELSVLSSSQKRTVNAYALEPVRLLVIPFDIQNPILGFGSAEATLVILQNMISIIAERFRNMEREPRPRHWCENMGEYRALQQEAIAKLIPLFPQNGFAGFFARHQLKPGKNLFLKGSASDALYFITNGTLDIIGHRPGAPEVILGNMAAPAIIGEIGFFSGEPRTATVRAFDDVTYYSISSARFREIREREPEKAVVLMSAALRLIGALFFQRVSGV